MFRYAWKIGPLAFAVAIERTSKLQPRPKPPQKARVTVHTNGR